MKILVRNLRPLIVFFFAACWNSTIKKIFYFLFSNQKISNKNVIFTFTISVSVSFSNFFTFRQLHLNPKHYILVTSSRWLGVVKTKEIWQIDYGMLKVLQLNVRTRGLFQNVCE